MDSSDAADYSESTVFSSEAPAVTATKTDTNLTVTALESSQEMFKCQLCSYSTIHKRYLKGHILIHSNSERFSCSACSYKTHLKSRLSIHSLIHSNRKDYSCQICLYRTNRKSSLVRHNFIHSDRKNYSCQTCSYTAGYKAKMNKHMLSHLKIKRYSCQNCSYSTNFTWRLKKHIRRRHECSQNAFLSTHEKNGDNEFHDRNVEKMQQQHQQLYLHHTAADQTYSSDQDKEQQGAALPISPSICQSPSQSLAGMRLLICCKKKILFCIL